VQVIGAVAAFVVVLVLVATGYKRRHNSLKQETLQTVQRAESTVRHAKENVIKLEEELKLQMQYSDEQKIMINQQIQTFRKEIGRVKEAQGEGDKELERLLINADNLESGHIIGKG
jgi:hypothetical protein